MQYPVSARIFFTLCLGRGRSQLLKHHMSTEDGAESKKAVSEEQVMIITSSVRQMGQVTQLIERDFGYREAATGKV